jgi:hypothetical protein
MHRSKYQTLFFRSRRELPPDFLGRKGGAFYAPVHLIDTKRRYFEIFDLSIATKVKSEMQYAMGYGYGV